MVAALIRMKERTTTRVGCDRGKAGQHDKGKKGRQQSQADRKRRQPSPQGEPAPIRQATDRTMGSRCLRWSFRQGVS